MNYGVVKKMNVIEMNAVRKRYGTYRMEDITFALPEGCVLGVIGENGAGKSTLIRMILGLTAPDSGTVSVLRTDGIRYRPDIRQKIGFVLDRPGIYPALNAMDLNSILKDTYAGWDEETYISILTQLDVPLRQRFKTLSQGNQMKLAIAAALSHNAGLLVLDEAANGLDPAARAMVTNMLYDYTKDEHHTVLISSHITGDIEKIADYILFLHQGKILLFDEKDAVMDSWRHVVCEKHVLDAIDPDLIAARRDTEYHSEAIISCDAAAADMEISHASLEQIFTALTKGVI